MTKQNLNWLSATNMAAAVTSNSLSPNEIAESVIERIDAVNPYINAIVQFDREQVKNDAAELSRRQESGEKLGPLHGVPFTINDLTAVEGLPTTLGNKQMVDKVTTSDAVVVERLRAAGGLFLGKTNTPESGYFGGNDNHLYGPTHNPWKHDNSAGGSSGGAAAAVAAGLGPLAEGSDGAGSVRIPSALCGVVGLKPTTGVVPQTILPGRFFNWACHGPITRTVADNALMLDVMAGPDNADPLSTERAETSYVEAAKGAVKGLRVAWSPNLGLGDADPEMLAVCVDALSAFGEMGAHVTESRPKWGNPSESMWNGICVPGFAAVYDMLDWESQRGEIDDNLIELMHEADRLTGVDVGRAEAFRGLMWDEWTKFMNDFDVLVSPTLASAAFPLPQFTPSWLEGMSLREQTLDWLFTYPYNMLNNPAITVPAGHTADGRPVGLQIASRHRQDAMLLRVAANFEGLRPWSDMKPRDLPGVG